jgi:hypothetical protein
MTGNGHWQNSVLARCTSIPLPSVEPSYYGCNPEALGTMGLIRSKEIRCGGMVDTRFDESPSLLDVLLNSPSLLIVPRLATYSKGHPIPTAFRTPGEPKLDPYSFNLTYLRRLH